MHDLKDLIYNNITVYEKKLIKYNDKAFKKLDKYYDNLIKLD